MRALQLVKCKKGIYSIITTLILVITILVGIGMLFAVNNTLLVIKEEENIGSQEKNEFKNINDRLFYCYGNIINTSELIDNLECMNLKEKFGFSIRKLEYLDCPKGVVKELNYRGTGMIERYHIPIYHSNQATVCPAELTIYQNAGQVPLILGVTLSPLVGVQGTSFAATINFYHSIFPSYFNLSVVNSEEVMRIDSGAMGQGTDLVTLNIASSGLEPGLYTATIFATHDRAFIEIAEDTGRFRIVDPDDEPVLNSVVAPPLPGSIWDLHRIDVNLSDYVDIDTVQAVISRDGVEVDRIDLVRIRNMTDEDLKTDYIYSGTWDSNGMPNLHATYNISIVATNELGNTMQTLSSAAIFIESGATGLVLIFSNNRVDSTLGTALNDYRAALTFDGYASEYVRLDSNDVTQCYPGLTPAPGPTISASDALLRIPSCIAYFESDYGNLLDDSAYVLIIGGHNQIEFSLATGVVQIPGISSDYYTDDYFADLNGDSMADRPIGRLPDGISGSDNTYLTALETATRLHNERGWQSRGSDYLWSLDIPRGAGSPTVAHIECINYALDSDQTNNCADNPNCYFAPPYNQGVGGSGQPPGWTEHSDMLYVCGHGYPDDPTQLFEDHLPLYANMGDSTDIAQRDMTDTVFFHNPCWGGRIHNVDPDGSVVLQALLQGAAAVFAGTSYQGYSSLVEECSNMPMTIELGSGSTYMANLAYKINREDPRTIGDAWLTVHNQCTRKMQREMNVMYGDPSIRVK